MAGLRAGIDWRPATVGETEQDTPLYTYPAEPAEMNIGITLVPWLSPPKWWEITLLPPHRPSTKIPTLVLYSWSPTKFKIQFIVPAPNISLHPSLTTPSCITESRGPIQLKPLRINLYSEDIFKMAPRLALKRSEQPAGLGHAAHLYGRVSATGNSLIKTLLSDESPCENQVFNTHYLGLQGAAELIRGPRSCLAGCEWASSQLIGPHYLQLAGQPDMRSAEVGISWLSRWASNFTNRYLKTWQQLLVVDRWKIKQQTT